MSNDLKAEGWTKLRRAVIVKLVCERGWHFRHIIRKGQATRLQLVNHRGRKWDFKLRSGCWIRPV